MGEFAFSVTPGANQQIDWDDATTVPGGAAHTWRTPSRYLGYGHLRLDPWPRATAQRGALVAEVRSAFCLDFSAWAPGGGKLMPMVCGTLVLLFVSLFDIAGVQYGLFGMAQLLEDGAVPRSNTIFASAGISTMAGALLGTSPVIIANESSAGIMEGAKTGLSALVVSVLFVFSAFITPLLRAVPHVATAVPLVLIGAFMMAPCCSIDWDNLRTAIPAFLTITVVPFTYSIHNGIVAGILMDIFLEYVPKAAKDTLILSSRPSPRSSPKSSFQIPGPGGGTLVGSCSTHSLDRLYVSPHVSIAGNLNCDRQQKVDSTRRLLSTFVLNAAEKESPEDARRDEALINALEVYLDVQR